MQTYASRQKMKRPGKQADAVNAPSAVPSAAQAPAQEGMGERLDDLMQARFRQHFLDNQIPSAEREADRLSANVGGGTPDQVKSQLGRQMGADFSGVRFHTDSNAAGAAERMGARAYTSGQDVYFGRDGFDAGVAAHELVHTVQQGVVDSAMSTVSAPLGGVQMDPLDEEEEKKKKQEQQKETGGGDNGGGDGGDPGARPDAAGMALAMAAAEEGGSPESALADMAEEAPVPAAEGDNATNETGSSGQHLEESQALEENLNQAEHTGQDTNHGDPAGDGEQTQEAGQEQAPAREQNEGQPEGGNQEQNGEQPESGAQGQQPPEQTAAPAQPAQAGVGHSTNPLKRFWKFVENRKNGKAPKQKPAPTTKWGKFKRFVKDKAGKALNAIYTDDPAPTTRWGKIKAGAKGLARKGIKKANQAYESFLRKQDRAMDDLALNRKEFNKMGLLDKLAWIKKDPIHNSVALLRQSRVSILWNSEKRKELIKSQGTHNPFKLFKAAKSYGEAQQAKYRQRAQDRESFIEEGIQEFHRLMGDVNIDLGDAKEHQHRRHHHHHHRSGGGTGGDTAPAAPENDTGTGAGNETSAAAENDTGTGAGNETPAAENDTGTGAANETPTAAETDSGTGTGTDTPTAAENDTGTGVANETPAAAENETGTGAGNETPTAAENDTGTGAANETPAVAENDTGTEAANGTPAAAENDTGTEAANETPTAAENDTGTEAANETPTAAENDTGTEAANETPTAAENDTGTGAANETPAAAETDSGTGTETDTTATTETGAAPAAKRHHHHHHHHHHRRRTGSNAQPAVPAAAAVPEVQNKNSLWAQVQRNTGFLKSLGKTALTAGSEDSKIPGRENVANVIGARDSLKESRGGFKAGFKKMRSGDIRVGLETMVDAIGSGAEGAGKAGKALGSSTAQDAAQAVSGLAHIFSGGSSAIGNAVINSRLQKRIDQFKGGKAPASVLTSTDKRRQRTGRTLEQAQKTSQIRRKEGIFKTIGGFLDAGSGALKVTKIGKPFAKALDLAKKGVDFLGGGESARKEERKRIVNEETKLKELIQTFRDRYKQAHGMELDKHDAKHITLKALGFQSGKRREVFQRIAMRRAKRLTSAANKGDELGKGVMKDLGLRKTGKGYDMQSVSERLGMDEGVDAKEQIQNTIKSRQSYFKRDEDAA